MEERTIVLTVMVAGERLDKYLAQTISDLSRAQVQRLIAAGRVTVNDVGVNKASLRLEVGDEVMVRVPPPESTEVHPEAIPLSIVYEDDDLLVIDKPAGMVVHPAHGHRSGTLVNALLSRYPQLAEVGGAERAGIVHRLDKDTSGLILVAKNEAAQKELQRQFKHHAVEKVYLALVEGRDYVVPDDIKRLAVSVLAHRIIGKGFAYEGGQDEREKIVRGILETVEVPV